jgi:hypothetical protein
MTTASKVIGGIWIGISAILGLILGTIIGWIYLGIIKLINFYKNRIKLSPSLQRILSNHYPSIDLYKIKIISMANGILYGKTGLTQGNEIFFKCTFSENNIDNLKLLLHELVHVKQYTKYGMWKFYILYAYGYINKVFSYPDIPLEKEAFDYAGRVSDSFLSDHALLLKHESGKEEGTLKT